MATTEKITTVNENGTTTCENTKTSEDNRRRELKVTTSNGLTTVRERVLVSIANGEGEKWAEVAKLTFPDSLSDGSASTAVNLYVNWRGRQ